MGPMFPEYGTATATSFVPFADEATHFQLLLGALVAAQVAPEFVEMKIGHPMLLKLALNAATSLVPSADAAMTCEELPPSHDTGGDVICIQVTPEFVDL